MPENESSLGTERKRPSLPPTSSSRRKQGSSEVCPWSRILCVQWQPYFRESKNGTYIITISPAFLGSVGRDRNTPTGSSKWFTTTTNRPTCKFRDRSQCCRQSTSDPGNRHLGPCLRAFSLTSQMRWAGGGGRERRRKANSFDQVLSFRNHKSLSLMLPVSSERRVQNKGEAASAPH